MSDRESWGNHCEFFLSSLGLAVGLGNVWRFPYVCYTNGGGSFLIPYLIMLFLVGAPALFVEQSLGQYGRVGCNKVFARMAPAFRGLGYGFIFCRVAVNIFYVIICAWAFFYLFAGMRAELPWSTCTNSWNTVDCYSAKFQADCAVRETFYSQHCIANDLYCVAHGYSGESPWGFCTRVNEDGKAESVPIEKVIEDNGISPAEDYYNGFVLGLTKDSSGAQYSWTDYGQVRWELALCLLLTWIVICLTLIRGVQSMGKAAYVITLSPYFVLTALLIYACTLDGAIDGINYFLSPEWDRLTDVNIWAGAASQILFSLSVGFGSQLVLSSYNSITNNTQRDALIISICNSLTSIYAGFVVFAILGFLSKQTESSIDKVVQGGPSLAFVSYPTAVLEMDVPPLWSFLFFFMLINLALSSLCGGVQTFIAFLLDEMPSLNKHRTPLVVVVCLVHFLLGLPFTTNGGIHLFTVFDDKATSSLLFLTFLEIVLVAWVYGIATFIYNLGEMEVKLSKQLRWLWTGLLCFITPGVLGVITVLAWIDNDKMAYNDYVYPDAVQAFGWVLELAPLVFVAVVPLITLIGVLKRGEGILEGMFKPTREWFETDRGGEAKAVDPKLVDKDGVRGMINQGFKE